uniref:Uncharacterized protein n=1 Tax=Tetradesmus obliquus TaxID=3088 RepID=A0A383VH99_TETOB|eukprot:jgi/Sobl393_1/17046/SZX64877.1
MGADSGDGSSPKPAFLGTSTAAKGSTAMQRHPPAAAAAAGTAGSANSRGTSAAGASAAISVSIPSARVGHKGSTGGAGNAGFGRQAGPKRILLSANQFVLLCVLALLLLLPLSLLANVHRHGPAAAGSSGMQTVPNWLREHVGGSSGSTVSSTSGGSSSSSVGGSSSSRGKVIDLDNIDLSKWEPLPRNYQAAKAIITASKNDGESSSSSSGGSSSSSSSSDGHCIPPFRATSWEAVDAEAARDAAGAAAASQQQQQEEVKHERAVEDEEADRRRLRQLQQQQPTAAAATAAVPAPAGAAATSAAAPVPAPDAAAAGDDDAGAALDAAYYDAEAATADAVPLGAAAAAAAPASDSKAQAQKAAAAAAAAPGPAPSDSEDTTAAAVKGIEYYYDADAAEAAGGEAAASGSNAATAASGAAGSGTTTPAAAPPTTAATATPGTAAAAAASSTTSADTAAADEPTGQQAYKPAEPEQPKSAAAASAAAAAGDAKGKAAGSYASQFDAPAPGTAKPSSSSINSSSSSSAAPTPSPAPPAAPIDVAAAVGGLRIALVNDVEFHHEVTLGLMAALQKHRERLTVYLHDSMFKPKDSSSSSSSSFDLVSYVDAVMPGNSLRNAYYKEGINETDVAIFVSPEFSIGYYREFIRRARPRMLIVFIHEPNMDLSRLQYIINMHPLVGVTALPPTHLQLNKSCTAAPLITPTVPAASCSAPTCARCRLQYIINMHPLVGVAALSPHVAATVKARMRMHHVHWMMPVHAVGCANTCFEGWAVQGKFEGQRRSYSSLWEAMADQLAAAGGGSGSAAVQAAPARLLQQPQQPGRERGLRIGSSSSSAVAARRRLQLQHRRTLQQQQQQRQYNLPTTFMAAADSSSSSRSLQQAPAAAAAAAVGVLPRINLLGSGQPPLLGLPQQLRPHVFLYRDLGYADYYDTLCRSQALLPLFNASSGYLRDKISSSVLASLAAGVPLMVPRRFLEVYEAFKEEHVLLLDDGASGAEPGAAELASISKLSGPEGAATLAARRKALAQLRHVLNQHAAAKLDGLMVAAASRPHASTKQD